MGTEVKAGKGEGGNRRRRGRGWRATCRGPHNSKEVFLGKGAKGGRRGGECRQRRFRSLVVASGLGRLKGGGGGEGKGEERRREQARGDREVKGKCITPSPM